jgi:hypothetical protein
MNKRYIGDGVYAEIDEDCGDLILTTENGIAKTNSIVLEADVWNGLLQYVRAMAMSHPNVPQVPAAGGR